MSRIHFDETGFTEIANNGEITRPAPIAFKIWTIMGGWKPICNKHKKIFVSWNTYNREHAYCNTKKLQPYPEKDWYWIKVPSYTRVWL